MGKELELDYARQALGILRTCLELMAAGRREFYRVAAVQLRLLLCDTTRQHSQVVDISLAGRLWPELKLPRLDAGGAPGEGGSELARLAWLEQRLEPEGITLRQLIRRVVDQDGGAHVDLKPNAGLPEALDVAEKIARLGAVVAASLEKLLCER